MFGILVAAALASGEAPPLDAAQLQKAMAAAIESGDTRSLAGVRFRVVSPFTDERVRKYSAFKKSARWTYDSRRKILTASIGLGELDKQNFRQFDERGLDALPPLQTLFFHVENRVQRSAFSRFSRDGSQGMAYDVGTLNKALSFGLAIPYREGGTSALPSGYSPLVSTRVRAPRDVAEKLAKTMSVVFEGEITNLGQRPEVFCGDYRGQMMSQTKISNDRFVVKDRQCFVTARIDRVEVVNGEAVLSAWPTAPKATD